LCQDLVVNTSGQVWNVPIALEGQPLRPTHLAQAFAVSGPLGATVEVACTGGDPNDLATSPNCNTNPSGTTIQLQSATGAVEYDVFQCYLTETFPYQTGPALAGATCTLTVTATGASSGTLRLVVDTATRLPRGPDTLLTPSPTEVVSTTETTPNDIPFVEEGHAFRLQDAGTGAPAFGSCAFDPVATPEPSDNMRLTYSPATGPGLDCCAYTYRGVDEVLSDVGQIILPVDVSPPFPDGDGDGFLDPCDACPSLADANYDRGGVNSTDPDLIGDGCQCGDLNSDGTVNAADVLRLREYLGGLTTFSASELARCAVDAALPGCDLRTVAILARAVANPARAPGIAQACPAAM
jgi:hypothetical protein